MQHKGLKEHKILSAPDDYILDNKRMLQEQKWKEKWKNLQEKRKIMGIKESGLQEAKLRTEEAIESLEEIENILNSSLIVSSAVDWEKLKKKDLYSEKIPSKPIQNSKKDYPSQPIKKIPKFSFIEKLFKSKKDKKIQYYEDEYSKKISEWEKLKLGVDNINHQIDLDFKNDLKKWKINVNEWEKTKREFFEQQEIYNDKIDEIKKEYLNNNPDSIVSYCEMVLNNSKNPEDFPNNFQLEYNPENKILILEYELPSLELMPNIKEVKYISSRNQLKEIYISESQLNKMFDETIYKITLKTLHELFKADLAKALEGISFNGWVRSINKATGKEENNCILSIQVKKDEFTEIDLSKVDPKACFKNLKGVASSKLSTLTPVQPIMQISKVDKRFIEGYEVADELDTSTNIAAIDWQDFEHLIRELFEKEFKTAGGEVKVTQSSRDGGVDAVAFDPDPIRGGKIVIQAKRYTNVVGVSAVRDLYGTVINEGATKGILITTATYGADAYKFAKGKPLTLLNGSNLLHLLEKHGHHARIDLREAKKILAEKQ